MDGGISLLLKGRGDGSFEPVLPADSGIVVAGDAKGLVTTDLDGDHRPDLLVGINNDRAQAFLNRTSMAGSMITVRLRGAVGNPTAVGARVTVRLIDGSQQTAEVNAGSGYLSQSSSDLCFGTRDEAVETIEVVWPNGRQTVERPPADSDHVTIQEDRSTQDPR